MKINVIYKFSLETTKESNLLKKLGETITSSKTINVYYPSSELEIKRNKDIVMIFLSKEKNGIIAYVCNYVFGVGEFIFYTHKELERIKETWTLVKDKEKPLFNQWRMLWYKDSVIAEFVDPMERAIKEAEEAEQELAVAKDKTERAKEKLQEYFKKFGSVN
jgi:hypothetical protein